MPADPEAWRERRSNLIASGFALLAFALTAVRSAARTMPLPALIEVAVTAACVFVLVRYLTRTRRRLPPR